MHGLADIIVDAAPFAYRRDNGGEVVVHQRHVGSALGNVGAGDAHGTTDISRLESRRVIDAVAGHRHNVAALLPRFHDADFVRRRDAREHAVLGDVLIQLIFCKRFHFRPADGKLAFVQDAELLGNGGGGNNVVAGDHDGVDAGGVTVVDSVLDFFTRRVDHTNQTGEGQIAFQRLVGVVDRGSIKYFECHRQHAQGILRHSGVRLCGIVEIAARAASENRFGSTLDHHDHLSIRLMDGGHTLAVGVKRRFADERHIREQLGFIRADTAQIG